MTRWIAVILLAGMVALLHTQIFYSDWGSRIEPLALDLWFNIRGEIDPPEDVMLVAIDEDSYQELEVPMDQAWPRSVHAKLLKWLAEAGARRVVFDVLFLGPSGDAKVDAELAKAFAGLPTAIGADSGTAVGAFKIEQLLLPHEPFMKAVEKVALVGLPEDAGVVRRYKTQREGRAKRYPTLAEAGAGVDHESKELPGERDLIWYYGPAGTIPTYSYYEVLDPNVVPDEELRDKVVYCGLLLRTEVGPAQKDSYLTPFWTRGRMFGVEIHATSAANLMTKTWITRASPWKEGTLLALVAFAMTVAFFNLRPQWAGLLYAVFGIGWAATAFSLFLSGFFIPGTVLTVLILPIVYLGSTLYYYFVTQRAQKQTQKAFEFYLSPQMAREVGKDPKALALGGESVYATALFTDIVDFTKITEAMNAQNVAGMLNSYFTEVMGVIFDNQGTLIKFIGDAVFALWGAPLKLGDHSEKAVQTAIAIQREVERFNASGRFPPLFTRVGVATGPMVVGNLGSARRFDYTAVGDTVNLASRVEGINKYFGTKILISDTSRKELTGSYNVLSMGAVNVAGKDDPVVMHTIFAEPVLGKVSELWLTGLSDFKARDWAGAAKHFEEATARDERLKTACELYFEQIEIRKNTETDRKWSGEIIFSTK